MLRTAFAAALLLATAPLGAQTTPTANDTAAIRAAVAGHPRPRWVPTRIYSQRVGRVQIVADTAWVLMYDPRAADAAIVWTLRVERRTGRWVAVDRASGAPTSAPQVPADSTPAQRDTAAIRAAARAWGRPGLTDAGIVHPEVAIRSDTHARRSASMGSTRRM